MHRNYSNRVLIGTLHGINRYMALMDTGYLQVHGYLEVQGIYRYMVTSSWCL